MDVITTTPEKPLVIFFETPKPEIGNIGTTTVIPTTLPTFHISSTPKIIEKPITTTIIEIQKAIESFEQTGEAPKVSAQPTPFPTETPDILGPKEVPINPDVIKPETPKEILYASDPLPDVKLSSLNEKEKPLVNLIPIISLNDGLKTGPPLFKVNPPVIIIHHDQNVTTKIDIPVVPKDDNSLFVLLADDETNDGVKITSKKPVVVINHDFDIKEDARAQELAFLQNLLTKLNNNKESQIFDLNNLPPNVQIIEDKNEIASIKQMFNIETEMQSQNKVFVSKIQDPKIYLSKTQKNEEEIKIGQDILQIIKSGEIDTSKLIKIETPEDLESVKQEIKISILNSLNNLYEKENLELKENPTPEVTTKLTPKPRGNRKWRPKHHHRTTRQTLGTTPERIPANVKDAFKEIFSIDLENERRDSIPISPPNKNNCNPKIGNNKCGSEFSIIPEKTINQDDLVHSINSGKFPIANLLPNGHTPEMYSPEVLEEIQKDIGGALLKGIAKYYVGSLDNKNDSHNGSLSDFLRIGKTQNK